jgi:hypothetical protein
VTVAGSSHFVLFDEPRLFDLAPARVVAPALATGTSQTGSDER